jgi:hypothetical protein
MCKESLHQHSAYLTDMRRKASAGFGLCVDRVPVAYHCARTSSIKYIYQTTDHIICGLWRLWLNCWCVRYQGSWWSPYKDVCPFPHTHPSSTYVHILVLYHLYTSNPPASILMSLSQLHYVNINDSSIVNNYAMSMTSPNIIACPIKPSHPLVMYWSRPM